MTSVNALTLNETSKAIANTCYLGTYINLDTFLEQQQVKVVVTQENNQQELTYHVILENADLAVQLSDTYVLNSHLQEEATNLLKVLLRFTKLKTVTRCLYWTVPPKFTPRKIYILWIFLVFLY